MKVPTKMDEMQDYYSDVLLGAGYYDVDYQVARAFAESLFDHIRFVQEAALKLGLPESQIIDHDASKFTAHEFPGYAMHFKGGGAPDAFASAWLHHLHANPHHWQHYIFPDGFTPKGSQVENGCLEMPYHFAREMIADWMGASMAYTGSWDMMDWLHKNMPKIRVHSKTAEFLREELDALSYADVVYMQRFAHEEPQP